MKIKDGVVLADDGEVEKQITRECDLYALIDRRWQRIGSYIFAEFEPQLLDVLLDIEIEGKIVKEMRVSDRRWKDGRLRLLIEENYRVIV